MKTKSSPNLISSNPDFLGEIDHVLGSEVSPENIDTIAEDTLHRLVQIVEDVVDTYNRYPTIAGKNQRQTEDSAFQYFNLQHIERILDDITDKAELIQSFDSELIKVLPDCVVFVPPQDFGTIIVPGSGEFKAKQSIPRLKTLLYLLATEFEISTDDILLSKGTNTSSMMRQESYVLVDIPDLQRAVLVCDEEGNATYVFDTQRLQDVGIGSIDLTELDKNDLNDLIFEQRSLGSRVIYGKNWAGRLVEMLAEDVNNEKSGAQAEAPSIAIGHKVNEQVPEDYLHSKAMTLAWNTSYIGIKKALDALGESLGEIHTSSFGANKNIRCYSPEQQAMIRQWLTENGYLGQEAPEGYLSRYSLVKAWEVADSLIQNVVNTLGESLGEVGEYKFGGQNNIRCYSPEQQAMIRQWLTENGYFGQEAPEGYLSRSRIGRVLGVDSRSTVKKALDALGESLGEVRTYTFGSRQNIPGYSPEQQTMIHQWLTENGYLGQEAPEGYLSRGGIGRVLGVDSGNTVQKALDALGESLGEVRTYTFGSRQNIPGYSPEQQAMIRQWLTENSRSKIT